MKPIHLVLASAMLIAISSCMPSMKITADWTNKEALPEKKLTKIFIAALTGNLEAKRTLESDFEKKAINRGLQVVKSGDLFFPNFDEKNAPDKETVLRKIKELKQKMIKISEKWIPYRTYACLHLWKYKDTAK